MLSIKSRFAVSLMNRAMHVPSHITFFSRSLEKKVMWGGTSIPWSEVVAVSLMEIRCPDDARNYSSFLAKYVLKNRHSLHTRWNDLTTVAVIVSSSFGNDTKQWVFETTP